MLPSVEPALVQDDRLKEEWEALSPADKDRYGFEHDTMAFLADLVDEMDGRIAASNSRLEAAEPAAPEVAPETVVVLQELKDQITELLEADDGRRARHSAAERAAISTELDPARY